MYIGRNLFILFQVDAKTKKLLEEYIVDRIKKSGDDVPIPTGDEMEGYTDEDMKYEDNLVEQLTLFCRTVGSTRTLDKSCTLLFHSTLLYM